MTTKEVRVMLQEIYLLGDAIKDKLGIMLDRETSEIRGALENDMLCYLIHLAAVDGKITDEEWRVIKEFTDVDLSEAIDDAEIDYEIDHFYHNYFGKMSEDEIPISFQIFKLAEDILYGDQTGSMVQKLIDIYENLGYEFRERVEDKRCFILMRHERFIEHLRRR